jgi:hypothetical protein
MPQTSIDTGRGTCEDMATKTDAATRGEIGLFPSLRPRTAAMTRLRAGRVGDKRHGDGMVMSEAGWLSAAHTVAGSFSRCRPMADQLSPPPTSWPVLLST